MFLNKLKKAKVRKFSIASYEKKKELPLQERLKFQSLNSTEISRSPRGLIFKIIMLVGSLVAIGYLTRSISTNSELKIPEKKVDLNSLEKVK